MSTSTQQQLIPHARRAPTLSTLPITPLEAFSMMLHYAINVGYWSDRKKWIANCWYPFITGETMHYVEASGATPIAAIAALMEKLSQEAV